MLLLQRKGEGRKKKKKNQSWARKMASWNSIPLEVTYEVLGWFAFFSWSISFYPQVFLNFRRKRYPQHFFIFFNLVFFPWCGFTFASFRTPPSLIFWIFSVVGLNFDFVLLNLTKHSSYLIYNACMYFSSAVQKQYFEKYGFSEVCFIYIILSSKNQ